MQLHRRMFFGLMGTAPLAAKAAADDMIAKAAGAYTSNGLGNAGIGLSASVGNTPQQGVSVTDGVKYLPYEQRVMGAADFVKAFGIPEVMEFELRDQARSISALDPDIACKASWSMSVKLMTQRERNYQRALARVERSGWQYRKRSALNKLIGFEWPW